MITYSERVLEDSPLAYWRFSDTSGTTLTDFSGNGRHGTQAGVGTITKNVDQILINEGNKAWQFNGSTAYVLSPSATWFPATNFTLETWVKTNTSAITRALICRDGQSNRFWQWRITQSGQMEFIRVGGSTYTLTCGDFGFINNNQPHHLAVTVRDTTGTNTGAEITCYVDGVVIGSVVLSGGMTGASNTQPLQIGALQGGSSSFSAFYTGVMDDAAVYGSVLSAETINEHYNLGVDRFNKLAIAVDFEGAVTGADAYEIEVMKDDPTFYFRLDETSGTTVRGSSRLPKDAQYSGSPALNAPGLINSSNSGVIMGSSSSTRVDISGTLNVAYLQQTKMNVEIWFKITEESVGNDQPIVARHALSAMSWDVYYRSPNLIFRVRDVVIGLGISTPIEVGKTYHLVAQHDGTVMAMYLNGQLVQSKSRVADQASLGAAASIGTLAGGYAGVYSRNAVFDEFAFYGGKILSPARIQAHYEAGIKAGITIQEWDGLNLQDLELIGEWDGLNVVPLNVTPTYWDGVDEIPF